MRNFGHIKQRVKVENDYFIGQQCNVALKKGPNTYASRHLLDALSLFGVCYLPQPVGTIKCHSPFSEEVRQL